MILFLDKFRYGNLSVGSHSNSTASDSRSPASQPDRRNAFSVAVGAFMSSRSNPSVAIGWGFFFGTFVAGNAGHSGSIFCLTAQFSAVRRNWRLTLIVEDIIPGRPRVSR